MKSKCIGRNKKGTPCRNSPIANAQYCRHHFPLELINKQSNKTIKLPNTVFWFVVGAVGEAVISDVFDYVKVRLGYEFIIPPIKSTESFTPLTPSTPTEVNSNPSQTHTPLDTPTPTPTNSPTPTFTPVPLPTDQKEYHEIPFSGEPVSDNDFTLTENGDFYSQLGDPLHLSSEFEEQDWLDIPDEPSPPITPLVSAQELEDGATDNRIATATSIGGGASILSMLPTTSSSYLDDYNSPPDDYTPPLDDGYSTMDEFQDNKNDKVYIEEKYLNSFKEVSTQPTSDDNLSEQSQAFVSPISDLTITILKWSLLILLVYIFSRHKDKY